MLDHIRFYRNQSVLNYLNFICPIRNREIRYFPRLVDQKSLDLQLQWHCLVYSHPNHRLKGLLRREDSFVFTWWQRDCPLNCIEQWLLPLECAGRHYNLRGLCWQSPCNDEGVPRNREQSDSFPSYCPPTGSSQNPKPRVYHRRVNRLICLRPFYCQTSRL